MVRRALRYLRAQARGVVLAHPSLERPARRALAVARSARSAVVGGPEPVHHQPWELTPPTARARRIQAELRDRAASQRLRTRASERTG